MSSLLIDKDLQQISKKVNLSISKTATLTEENSDLINIVDSLSTNKFTKNDYKNLSFALFAKLLIFKFTKNTDFTAEDKLFLAECLTIHYHTFKNKKTKTVKIEKFKSLDETKYYLLLYCLYLTKFKISISPVRLKLILSNNLWAFSKKLSKNLDLIKDIFQKIKKDGWI